MGVAGGACAALSPGAAGLVAATSAGIGVAGIIWASVTVPTNTTSPFCRPAHWPGGALEQVHALASAGEIAARSSAIMSRQCIPLSYIFFAQHQIGGVDLHKKMFSRL